MRDWKRIVDRQIAEVIGDGDVSHLPGAGERLPLKDEGATLGEWRLAFKIMNDHHVMPEWIEAAKRLDQLEASLRSQVQEGARRHSRELRRAKLCGAPERKARVESKWNRFQEDCRKRIEGYNREALVHNLSLPAGIPHKPVLRADTLIQRALQEARRQR
ncbi:MAG: DUF1992 domain-containing protein [Chloroflexi bacterium]|nr:DUF1992 domain-containing protein [Chloroflexota bacterium]